MLEAVFGAIVAVAVGAAGWGATKKYGNRRRTVEIRTRQVPLINDAAKGVTARAKALTVVYGGKALVDPSVLTIEIENKSDRDVSSEHFDRGRSITFLFNKGAILKRMNRSGGVEIDKETSKEISLQKNRYELHIAPGLLPAGRTWRVSILTDGIVDFSVDYWLIDTDVTVTKEDAKALEP